MSDKIVCSTASGEAVELPGGALDFIKLIAENWDKISLLVPIIMQVIQLFSKTKETDVVG